MVKAALHPRIWVPSPDYVVFATLDPCIVSARVQKYLARGRKGGRTFSITRAQVRLAQAAMGERETSVWADLCNELRITRATLYRYVGPNGELREHGRQVLDVTP